MSYFNASTNNGSGSGSGLVTKITKQISLTSEATASIEINISEDVENYAKISNDLISVELQGVSAGEAGDATLTREYNSTTGVITLTSTSSALPFKSTAGQIIDVIVSIAGAVQFPPTPEPVPITNSLVEVGDYAAGTTYNIATLTDKWQELTADNFFCKISAIRGGVSMVSGSSPNNRPVTIASPNNNMGNVGGASGGVNVSYDNKTGLLKCTSKSYAGASIAFSADGTGSKGSPYSYGGKGSVAGKIYVYLGEL